jgi:hypothetical protein
MRLSVMEIIFQLNLKEQISFLFLTTQPRISRNLQTMQTENNG